MWAILTFLVFIAGIALVAVSVVAFLSYLEHREERLRMQLQMDQDLKEWQQENTKEDIDEHRARMKRRLNEYWEDE